MEHYLQVTFFDHEPGYHTPIYHMMLDGYTDERLYSRYEMELYLAGHPTQNAKFILDTDWMRQSIHAIEI